MPACCVRVVHLRPLRQDICSVQERLNRIFGFCAIWNRGLLGYETVSTGSFDTCAVRLIHSVYAFTPTSAQR